MNHEFRLDQATRVRALECGQWQTMRGVFVDLRTMPDSHLVNAMLKAISDGDDARIVELLAVEIERREAVAMAGERERRLARFHRR